MCKGRFEKESGWVDGWMDVREKGMKSTGI